MGPDPRLTELESLPQDEEAKLFNSLANVGLAATAHVILGISSEGKAEVVPKFVDALLNFFEDRNYITNDDVMPLAESTGVSSFEMSALLPAFQQDGYLEADHEGDFTYTAELKVLRRKLPLIAFLLY